MKYMKRIETFNFERKSENEHRRSIIRIGNASYSGDRPFRDTVSFGSACAYTALLGLGICLIGDTVKGNNKVNRDIRLENAKTDNRIRYENACAENTMRIDNNRKKNKIEEMEARLKYSKFNSQLRPSRGIVTNVCSVNPSKWISDFEAKFPTPDFSKIPVLGKIISGCPDGYKVPMALHFLTAMGAICFSRVRSVYIDGRKHGPNLLLIVEGESGSGKSYFASIYKDLFLEVIEEDRIKYANGGANTIISTAGIDISAPKFAELLANNKDVHNFIMETEFSTVEKVFSRNSSLDSEILRKAFDNEQYYRNRFGKDQSNGIFNVFMNCSFTGTPQAINRFFNEGPKDFKRPGMAIDREVFTCHPPKVEAQVRRIIDEFRNGTLDEVPIWMEKNGKSMLVKYMAVRDKNQIYLGTLELVQNMDFAKEHFTKK